MMKENFEEGSPSYKLANQARNLAGSFQETLIVTEMLQKKSEEFEESKEKIKSMKFQKFDDKASEEILKNKGENLKPIQWTYFRAGFNLGLEKSLEELEDV